MTAYSHPSPWESESGTPARVHEIVKDMKVSIRRKQRSIALLLLEGNLWRAMRMVDSVRDDVRDMADVQGPNAFVAEVK